ncbi:hypothetical protein [Nocardia arizonensis]|uniref:hypothetical protein n=1 Tax=Nocardia arizonensis TaxID=1141647 RepID=UPI0012E8D67E|nr:hypothetical protein [Nocardia arizonensis]
MTDEKGEELFSEIASRMSNDFGISEVEAVARINSRFVGLEFLGNDLIFHQSDDYWAKDIMFGHDIWWKSESAMSPLPAPSTYERWLHTQQWWILYWKKRRKRQFDRLLRKHR